MIPTELGEIIKQIRKIKGLTQEDLAQLLGFSQPAIVKYESNKSRPGMEFISSFREKIGYDLTDPNIKKVISTAKGEQPPMVDFKKTLGELKTDTPILEVVLNLSYVGKKNADSMEKMAATNQRNTDIIAALVSAILPNSKLGQQLAASLASQHTGDDLPVESFLGQSLKDIVSQQEKVSSKGSAKNK